MTAAVPQCEAVPEAAAEVEAKVARCRRSKPVGSLFRAVRPTPEAVCVTCLALCLCCKRTCPLSWIAEHRSSRVTEWKRGRSTRNAHRNIRAKNGEKSRIAAAAVVHRRIFATLRSRTVRVLQGHDGIDPLDRTRSTCSEAAAMMPDQTGAPTWISPRLEGRSSAWPARSN